MVAIWKNIRKGGISLHLEYGGTFTNNLSAKDFRARGGDIPEIEFSLDHALRTHNKQVNSYLDARQLADGDINKLELIQIVDAKVAKSISQIIQLSNSRIHVVKLTILLEIKHYFRCRLELGLLPGGGMISLRVLPVSQA